MWRGVSGQAATDVQTTSSLSARTTLLPHRVGHTRPGKNTAVFSPSAYAPRLPLPIHQVRTFRRMRKISLAPIAVFSTLLLVAMTSSVASTAWLLGRIPFGDFRGIVLVFGAVVMFYVYSIVLYRLVLLISPLHEGVIDFGSREEFVFHVYELFFLVLFFSLTRTRFVPVPLMRWIYIALGARLGDNSFSGGTLLDPPLTEVGDNSIIGHDAILFCHVIEADKLALAKIHIGSNVTIGARAVIMPDVDIGDGAIVAVNAVVTKGTRIGPGERWAGIPARRIS